MHLMSLIIPILAALQLSCIIFIANRTIRNGNGGGLGTRLISAGERSFWYTTTKLHYELINSQVKGVKGPCVLALHQPFDLARGCVVDDLHCLYLGVTLQLLHFWFEKKHRTKSFYIGNKVCTCTISFEDIVPLCAYITTQVGQCDARLLNIKVPDVISRVPKSLSDLQHWKGLHTTMQPLRHKHQYL